MALRLWSGLLLLLLQSHLALSLGLQCLLLPWSLYWAGLKGSVLQPLVLDNVRIVEPLPHLRIHLLRPLLIWSPVIGLPPVLVGCPRVLCRSRLRGRLLVRGQLLVFLLSLWARLPRRWGLLHTLLLRRHQVKDGGPIAKRPAVLYFVVGRRQPILHLNQLTPKKGGCGASARPGGGRSRESGRRYPRTGACPTRGPGSR